MVTYGSVNILMMKRVLLLYLKYCILYNGIHFILSMNEYLFAPLLRMPCIILLFYRLQSTEKKPRLEF